MSFGQPQFEKLPEKPEEIKKGEKVETEDKKFEPVTTGEMDRWHELKKAELKLLPMDVMPGHPEWQRVQEELRELSLKRNMEAEKLVGPEFNRAAFFQHSKKEQREYADFLEKWDKLSEDEQFRRLNRVQYELKDMKLSTEEERGDLHGDIALNEEAGREYSKIKRNFKPLSYDDRARWRDLARLDSMGVTLKPKEVDQLDEFREKAKLEIEKLTGPVLTDFQILSSPSLRKEYLSFVKEWDGLSDREREDRLQRFMDITDKKRGDPIIADTFRDDRPIFEKIRKSYLEKNRNNKETMGSFAEGGKIYTKEFADKFNDVLRHEFRTFYLDRQAKQYQEDRFTLKDIVDKHLKGFSSPEFANLSMEEKAEKQKEFVKDLGRGINSIPGGDPWSFYFGRIMETGKINCSGSTALAGMILESTKEKTGIKSVEHGTPFGHTVNMITFGDGRLYWADIRNGTFEDVSDYAKIEEKEGLKVYKINQPSEKTGDQIGYRIVPVSSTKEGIIGSYLENLHSAHQAADGKFDKALKMGHSKEELEEIKNTAKEVCQERGLSSPEQFHHLIEMKEFFTGKLDEYQKSKEFKNEIRRIEKIIK